MEVCNDWIMGGGEKILHFQNVLKFADAIIVMCPQVAHMFI